MLRGARQFQRVSRLVRTLAACLVRPLEAPIQWNPRRMLGTPRSLAPVACAGNAPLSSAQAAKALEDCLSFGEPVAFRWTEGGAHMLRRQSLPKSRQELTRATPISGAAPHNPGCDCGSARARKPRRLPSSTSVLGEDRLGKGFRIRGQRMEWPTI